MSEMNKSKKKHSLIKEILSNIPDKKGLLIFTLIITSLGKIGLAAAPKVSGKITDELSEYVSSGVLNMSSVITLCVITAVLYFFGNGIDGFVQKNMVFMSQTLSERLRNKAAKKFNRLSLGYLDTHPAGDIQAVTSTDILTVGTALESSVPTLLGQTVLLVGIFVMMLVTNWKLTLIYVVTLPLTLMLMLVISKMTTKLFAAQMNTQGDMNAFVSDTCSNHMIIRSFDCADEKQKEFDRLNKQYYKEYVKSRFVSGFMIPIGSLSNNVSFILLCLIGGNMMIKGNLTIGGFQAFLFYGNMLNSPMTSIASSINSILEASAAMGRVTDFLAEEEMPVEESTEKLDVNSLEGNVTFDHVRFGYIPEKTLMQDVSFETTGGSTIAIVGPSGAGKTTLINLLLRFYDINDGKIKIDNKNIADIDVSEVRSAFGMVLQDSWIFDGTIAENIGYGKSGAGMDDIVRAAKIANCDDIIRKLPDGYDTYISTENSALSAGEMQLISIARCVLSDPKILILDEATSQVDSRTEYLIARAMEKLMEGRTCFMIAHRLFTIKNADKIIFMKDGDIKEVGSHDELITKNGLYAEMYRQA
ncbi:MAG: ABC transporter ATP-binding protein/permease [Eubacterium sp.]|nr:ABC transporter ATP-binding protein/permease [Eubacterium sp.]